MNKTRLTDIINEEVKKVLTEVSSDSKGYINKFDKLAKQHNLKEVKPRKKKEESFELAGLLKEGINKGLDYYYSNSETAVRERARKIDAILNKEIKSDSTKVELLELIKEMMDEYGIEYHDSAKPY